MEPPKPNFQIEGNKLSHIKHVIGVVSGKGGVGKSFVTSSLAVSLNKKGLKVGILDGDITGPSIPKMFGIKGPAMSVEGGTYPIPTKNGISVMSINLVLDDEEQPVIWRGPVIAGAVKQFWTDIIWGDVDVLLVDMPPGTGDVPLTVFQSLPLDGIVLVTSPQDLVSLIVKKAYNMAKMMDIPILGVVENYSYMACPDCGKIMYPFGQSKLDDIAKELDIKILAKLQMNPDYAELADAGKMDELDPVFIDDGVQHILKTIEK